MPAKKTRIKMQCTVCKQVNYFTNRAKTVTENKLERMKFCKTCKKHTKHKETKK